MKVIPTQVHWFRLRRSGLVEPFATPAETARRLIGVQAQLLAAADLAFWNRTADCAQELLKRERLGRRRIVRFWGQRDTLHIYDAQDWPLLHTVLAPRQTRIHQRLAQAGVDGELRRVVRQTAKRLANGKPLTYADIKSKKLAAGIRTKQMNDAQAQWAAAYTTFRELEREGIGCHGPDVGGGSSFVHREHWLSDLDWSPPPAESAFATFARRYLTTYGPAEARDLAFWYGTTVTEAKCWIDSAGESCSQVAVGDRTYWCCRDDLDELTKKPPPAGRWPVRLLYRFDPLVLAMKDKSWLIDEQHYKKVWRPSAHVEAVLLVRGRIAGTWRYERKTKQLNVRVSPFASLSRTVTEAADKQAAGIAAFLGLQLGGFEVAKP
ncbi:MAG: winged helix DNA-binding domain-containing protein [bacterium]|nr:winged helix DNA-binding domain-containing protein [bacterium]